MFVQSKYFNSGLWYWRSEHGICAESMIKTQFIIWLKCYKNKIDGIWKIITFNVWQSRGVKIDRERIGWNLYKIKKKQVCNNTEDITCSMLKDIFTKMEKNNYTLWPFLQHKIDYKFCHGYLALNTLLLKIGVSKNNKCTTCFEESETIEHFYFIAKIFTIFGKS